MKKMYFWIYTVLFFFSLFFLISIFLFDTKDTSRQFYSSNEATEWTDYSVSSTGGTTILKGTVSAIPNIENVLVFYSIHQNISIYCNDLLIYQYPVENNNPLAATPGYNWNFVSLPESENPLTITITSPYEGYSEDIPTFYTGNTLAITAKIININIISFLLCFVIFSLGVCMVIYWVYIRLHTPIKMNLLQLGVFAILLSVWSINESRFTTLLVKNNIACSYLSFISLMLLPLPFAMFVRSYYEDDDKIWDIFFLTDVIQIFICLCLQMFKLADLRQTLWTSHIMMGFLAVIVLTSSVKLLRNRNNSSNVKMNLICIIICIIALIADIFAYYYGVWDSNSFGRMGFLLYIIILGFSSIKESASLMKLGQKANTYQRLAFTDQMTNMSNRTAFDRDFDVLSASPNDVAVINLDLNNLKHINDTLGHSFGDTYITGAAKIISNTFANVGKCYRIGGDEFVVIIEQASHFDFLYYFNLMEWSIDSFNATQKDFHMQIAYGYAIYDSNVDKNLDATQRRADKNMYNNKKEKKRLRLQSLLFLLYLLLIPTSTDHIIN